MMKKLCMLMAFLLAASTLLTACHNGDTETGSANGDHTHTFEEHWSTDENDHWHAASCEHTEEIADKAAHVDEDGNDVCDVCGFRKDHVHTYEEAWTYNEKSHYHKNTCGHDDVEKYRDAVADHTDEDNDGACDVCAYDGGHTHTYAEEWTKADNGHWHAPTCGHDVPGQDLTDHTDADNNAVCDDCAYDYDHTHTFAAEWTITDNEHWHAVACGHDVTVADKGAHVDADTNGYCDVCEFQTAHFHSFEESWSSDANGHFHKATCGHDVKDAEAAHNGYEADGVCDTCAYVVFHFYTVSVKVNDDSIKVTAPDGTHTETFSVKEGNEATFTMTMPTRLFVTNVTGAELVGKPVKENNQVTYTFKIQSVTGDVVVDPFIDKNGNAEVVVPAGEQEMIIEKAWKQIEGTLTFHAPSSGHYIIYSTTHPGLTGVTFTVDGNTLEQDDTSVAYAFDVAAEGDITVKYRYFPMSKPASGKETFTYVVVKYDPEKTLTDMKGENYSMPTNVKVNLTFTVPTSGTYQITSTYPVAWDGDVTSPHVFTVAEGNLTQTISVNYHMSEAATYDFNWEIKQVGGTSEIEIGSTPVTAPFSDYAGYTLTAPYAGSYHFALSDKNMAIYLQSASGSMNQAGADWTAEDLAAGESVTVYVRVDIYNDEITDPIDGTLSIGFIPTVTNGDYNASVHTENIYVSEDHEDGEYLITLPAGGQISLDDGATWQSGVESLIIPGNGTLAYLVKADGDADTVVVHIEKIVYEHRLTVGENSVTLIPGQEYDLILTGTLSPDYYASYLLYWTDSHLTVVYSGQTLTSGAEIDRYSISSSHLTIVYSGSTAATVTLTLEDNYVAPDIDASILSGTYQVSYEGSNVYTVIMTPDAPGSYAGTLYVADHNTGIDGDISGYYYYAYTVEDGMVVSTSDGADAGILISSNAQGEMTFQCIGMHLPLTMTPDTEGGDEGAGGDGSGDDLTTGMELVLGENAVDVPYWAETHVSFTAETAGTYTIRLAADESNGEIGYEGEYGFEPYELPYSVTLAAGETIHFSVVTADYEADTVDLVIEKTA